MSDLLNAPERGAIETFLACHTPAEGEALSFERLLGFLSGVAMTPGGLKPSDWLQPLLEFNSIVFNNTDDATLFMDQLMPLYKRLDSLRVRGENLCPFRWEAVSDFETAQVQASQWGIGLHDALRLRTGIWAPEKHEARHVPAELLGDMENAVAFLWAIAEPDSIPHIMPDPVPFQRNFLSKAPGWSEENISRNWNDELVGMFLIMCLSRLRQISDTLQCYARAYDTGTRGGQQRPSAPPAKPRVGRNDLCPCGSGVKYKKCCGR